MNFQSQSYATGKERVVIYMLQENPKCNKNDTNLKAQFIFLLLSKSCFCIFQVPAHLPFAIRKRKTSQEALWGGGDKSAREQH